MSHTATKHSHSLTPHINYTHFSSQPPCQKVKEIQISVFTPLSFIFQIMHLIEL